MRPDHMSLFGTIYFTAMHDGSFLKKSYHHRLEIHIHLRFEARTFDESHVCPQTERQQQCNEAIYESKVLHNMKLLYEGKAFCKQHSKSSRVPAAHSWQSSATSSHSCLHQANYPLLCKIRALTHMLLQVKCNPVTPDNVMCNRYSPQSSRISHGCQLLLAASSIPPLISPSYPFGTA